VRAGAVTRHDFASDGHDGNVAGAATVVIVVVKCAVTTRSKTVLLRCGLCPERTLACL
jgi:hypothetical protein